MLLWDLLNKPLRALGLCNSLYLVDVQLQSFILPRLKSNYNILELNDGNCAFAFSHFHFNFPGAAFSHEAGSGVCSE